jgi:hypothetical protein
MYSDFLSPDHKGIRHLLLESPGSAIVMTSGDWKKQLVEWIARGELEFLLPEVTALRGMNQPEKYHPEGDVFQHTMQSVATVDEDDDQRVFWAVLLHDVGKACTTSFWDGRWRAHGHAEASAEMVGVVLRRFDLETLVEDVAWLVRHHQYELSWNLRPDQVLTPRQERFTKMPLYPMLLRVCTADRAGRKPVYPC